MHTRKVVVLGYNGAQVLDITGPHEVFANIPGPDGTQPYELTLASLDGNAIETTSGLTMQSTPYQSIDWEDLDTLIIAGGNGVARACKNPELIQWVQKVATQARRVCSVCSGSFVLAQAGLLDGKRATCHWESSDHLQRAFPAIDVDGDALYIQQGNIWTSAGVTAGIDMALALVAEDLGHDYAMAIARRLVVYAHRPGNQAQFSTLLKGQSGYNGAFSALIDWMSSHLKTIKNIDDVADYAGMSMRNFHRKFLASVGETPGKYLESLRLDEARSLLTRTEAPLKTIALETGFQTDLRLIKAFNRQLAMTPTAYRHLHSTTNLLSTPQAE